MFTRGLVQRLHAGTLQRGATLTKAAVKGTYWVPKLRSLTKSVTTDCKACKRIHTFTVQRPPFGKFPENRTDRDMAFEVIEVVFAGPSIYKESVV